VRRKRKAKKDKPLLELTSFLFLDKLDNIGKFREKNEEEKQ